ncbi:MAG: polysulfide reductase NrfD [Acidobacteriales bacterium]|nr:polysulfide reductase NrfD [Terriglobales bacterium]
MRYGFIIDNRKCIGCHACTVACKTEHDVPLGVNRTWVKYVEKGVFPNTQRIFQVTRCNHCEKPPCVTICPVSAMYKRKDGIVDFNSEMCIGCKACMQACPYDAIYIDPKKNTAAKCNFCAHRTEIGLEPACVNVCPEHAIIAGDLDEPDGEIARLRNREAVRVRKPEQGTQPKLYYIDGDESAIVPTASRHEDFYVWSQRNEHLHGGGAIYLKESPFFQKNALATYDVSHERPWGWLVPMYLWLKSIGSGVLALPAFGIALGWLAPNRMREIILATIALLFTAATVVCLVADLTRKERFLRILLHPQNKSWLARGTYILMLYSGLAGLVWLAEALGWTHAAGLLLWPSVFSGFFAAIYTAFLFGQCEGRDLWQTPLLPLHLLAQTLMCGAATYTLLPQSLQAGGQSLAAGALAAFIVLHFVVILCELTMPHVTDNAGYAVRLMTHGPFRSLLWGGAIGIGCVAPLILLAVGWHMPVVVAAAAVLALGGLFAFEWAFIMAGQSVPNS